MQDEFAAFCIMNTVPFGQLYGGKICAALNRQHPRDLFDAKFLLENEGFTVEVKQGFLFLLLGSNRPLHELLDPNLKDQRQVLKNQFDGMSSIPFSYPDFEETRLLLIKTIQQHLTKQDKAFLLSFINLIPDWSLYDFEKFPAIQWKLQNLSNLKNGNPAKHRNLIEKLERVLF